VLALTGAGPADEGRRQAAIIIQSILTDAGDYRGAIDGNCGPATVAAAARYGHRTGLLDTAEAPSDFCAALPAYYFVLFKDRQGRFTPERLGFRAVRAEEIRPLLRSCSRTATLEDDVAYFAGGSWRAMFSLFAYFLETPGEDAKDDASYRCLLKRNS
jgi:peptidoglycan hydrolase-like protein with peptidoglycan-binding domain